MRRLIVHFAACVSLMTVAQAQAPGDPTDQIAEGLPDYLFYPLQQSASPETSAGQFAVASLWPRDQVLKVCFFGGNAVVKKLVASVASEWNTYSSVKFDFGAPGIWRSCTNSSSGFSQIRLSFTGTGYWSLVGRQGEDIVLGSQATMNLQGFDRRYHPQNANEKGVLYTEVNILQLSRERDRGTILHEFGHALGLKHEHMNEALHCRDAIRWTESPTVYEYFAAPPNEWGVDKVDANLGRKPQTGPGYITGKADPKSVMMYFLPIAIKRDGAPADCFQHDNNAVSQLDKEFITSLYAAEGPAAGIDGENFPVPAAAVFAANSPTARNDALDRVKVDIVSDVTSVRREARRQLAGIVQTSRSPSLAAELAQEAIGKSYRRQLGVAEAIGGAKLDYKTDPTARSNLLKSLQTMKAANRDKTLDQALTAAQTQVE